MPAGIRPTAIVGIRMLLVAEVAGAGTCDYIVFLRAPPISERPIAALVVGVPRS